MDPNLITLNAPYVPHFPAIPHRFYASWAWWEDGQISPESTEYRTVMIPARQRFAGGILTSPGPVFNVQQAQAFLEQQEGHPVVILFWRECE